MKSIKNKGMVRVIALAVAAVMALAVLVGAIAGAAAEDAAGSAAQGVSLVQNVVFRVPVPEGYAEADSGENAGSGSQINWRGYQNESGDSRVFAQVTSYKKAFALDPEMARALYERQTETIPEEELLWKQEIMLDETHPACFLATSRVTDGQDGTQIRDTLVRLLYFYCCNMLEMYYEYETPAEENFIAPEYQEYLPVFSQVSYAVPEDRAGLPDWLVTPDCFVTTVSAKDDAMAVAAGGALQIRAEMQGEKLVRAMDAAATKQTWFLLDAQKTLTEGKWVLADKAVATVNQNGQVRASNTVKEIAIVQVVAYNQAVGYTASMPLLILPKQTSFVLSEKEATLYVEESDPLQVNALAEPKETLLFYEDRSNLTWTLSRDGELASLAVAEDGTATVTPLQAGNVTLTAKDTVSGRSARMNIKILTPVTGVEISGPETLAPGKAGSYKAALSPEKPSNRKVTWTIDQDSDIATISGDGRLTVKKDAPSGTVITVTCRAEGSSLDRTAEMKVTVE